MAKTQSNPFLDFDFANMMQDFKVPGVDVEAMMSTQQRNLAALQAANNLALEGMQAVAKRQAEILQSSMEEYGKAAQELMTASPEDKVGKQAELAKQAFEHAVSNMRELSEMVSKAQVEALETINKRVAQSFEEIQTIAKSAK